MAENTFKIIETQEQFDERIKERIERAEKHAREEFKGWTSPDDLKALNEKHAGEIKALNEKHSKELEKYAGYDEKFAAQASEIKGLKTSALKSRIAMEKHLPADAVEFLLGDDEETISASAEKLAKLSGANSVISYTKNTEKPAGDAKTEAFRQLARQIKGE